jgi:mono/diheme cytochrome c family protein
MKRVVGASIALMPLLLAPGFASGQNPQDGKRLYVSYCATCHGDQGRGDGPAGRALPVKPADHTNGAVMNQLSDKYLTDIIVKGGGAVGKSPIMPAWGNQFNEKQIGDLVAYIRSIAKPAGAGTK